jgi:glutamyl-Q tRNA(Asp) synthetase
MSPVCYRGRFAPSPTGALHVGSLYTALASFLEARAQQGVWLVRIDDLDQPRNVPGAADLILKTLESFGLHWDETVYYQSQHTAVYQAYLEQLIAQQWVYPCTCSRKFLNTSAQSANGIYPGFCRAKTEIPPEPYALRVKTSSVTISFIDKLQGLTQQNIAQQHGDFIVKRKEGMVAYPFAVVIDDYLQGITEVVRGVDLLDNTPAQLYLHQLLHLPPPDYRHVPIIVDSHGQKLSKQTYAEAVNVQNPAKILFYLLNLLKQQPPLALSDAPVSELLAWAIAHWQSALLKAVSHQPLPHF